MKHLKTYESLSNNERLTVYHNSPVKINGLIKRPIWTALTLKEGLGYYRNMINQKDESYLYKIELSGKFFKDDLEKFLENNGIDYYDFLSNITANPTEEELLSIPGIKLLIENEYDGIIHEDYDPWDNNKDAKVLLVFNPLKTSSSIKPINNANSLLLNIE